MNGRHKERERDYHRYLKEDEDEDEERDRNDLNYYHQKEVVREEVIESLDSFEPNGGRRMKSTFLDS